MTLFGINFAIGVATGIILEFEFGTNWSNYSWFVGDIFGAPLAIEGIMAFFHGVNLYRSHVLWMEQGEQEDSTWSPPGWLPSAPIFRHSGYWLPMPGCKTCRDAIQPGNRKE